MKKGIGLLTFALNNDDCNYEKLAYLMALSYKTTNKNVLPMAVVVNNKESCFTKLHNIFDYVINKKHIKTINAMHQEAYLMTYTPFSETIKVESDMLFTQDIYHWIKHLRLWDICFTNQIYGFDNKPADDKIYRKYIRSNNLPNTYNGFMYARYCKQSVEYFKIVDYIFNHWQIEKKKFSQFDNFPPSTDFAMAMACHYTDNINIGINQTGMPGFIHAKPWVTHRSDRPWHQEMKWSIIEPKTVIVNGYKSHWPIHYYDKNFCTQDLIGQYEQAI